MFINKVLFLHLDITKVYSIGKSVQGRNLIVLVFSSNPVQHVAGKCRRKQVFC